MDAAKNKIFSKPDNEASCFDTFYNTVYQHVAYGNRPYLESAKIKRAQVIVTRHMVGFTDTLADEYVSVLSCNETQRVASARSQIIYPSFTRYKRYKAREHLCFFQRKQVG